MCKKYMRVVVQGKMLAINTNDIKILYYYQKKKLPLPPSFGADDEPDR